MRSILYILLFIVSLPCLQAQTSYVLKAGSGVNLQIHTTGKSNPLIGGSFDVGVLSLEEDISAALYATIGYHLRGSSRRYTNIFNISERYLYHNVVAEVGVMKYLNLDSEDFVAYYLIGVQGEVSIANNLGNQQSGGTINSSLLSNEFVKRFIYGLSIGAGVEKEYFGKKFGLELNVSPNLSSQYDQPFAISYEHPIYGNVTIPPRRIRNVAIELKLVYHI